VSKIEAITVENLKKYFTPSKHGGKAKKGKINTKETIIKAVDNISFKVKKGEIFGFLGPNGAGKTTTIRMLTGVLKPSKGTTSIFGLDVWKNPIPVKQIIGNVPEEANVYLELSGLQNLTFIGELYEIPKTDRLERAKVLLKKFELYENRNMKSIKYSRGMKQRLLLCMALMSNPEILFLDEPTSGLDPKSAKEFLDQLQRLREQGKAILMTTHDIFRAKLIADRVGIMKQGRLVAVRKKQDFKHADLEEIYMHEMQAAETV